MEKVVRKKYSQKILRITALSNKSKNQRRVKTADNLK